MSVEDAQSTAGKFSASAAWQAEPQIFINGRFLAQNMSGVQRFAIEICAAWGRHAAATGSPAPIILAPRGSCAPPIGMEKREVGRLRGQAWEQLELPFHAYGGILVNLGNTAPLWAVRQAVVIHDTGAIRFPQSYSWKFSAWYKLMQKRLVRGRSLVITVSDFARSEIVACLGATGAEIGVIREGADHMQRLTSDSSIIAREDLSAGRYVLAVGNLAFHKNLPALGAAAKALQARGVELVITGGLDTNVFAKQYDRLPQPARYIGRVTDAELKALYKSAACFVFPSLYEGFGLPALEAMACGCPVLAAGIPALREICSNAAIFCDPADSAGIAEELCRMLDDAELREALSTLAQPRLSHYTWDNATQDLRLAIHRRFLVGQPQVDSP